MRSLIRFWLLPLLAVGLASFATVHIVASGRTPPAPPPPQEPERTPYGRTIHGIGLVEARTENIYLGAAVPGLVLEVPVDAEQVGKRVEAGAILFRVDDRQHQARLRVQRQRLSAARAELARLEQMPRHEELPPAEAKVRVAEANVRLTRDLFERARKMFHERAIGAEEHTQRQLAWEMAQHQLAQAQAEHDLLKAGAWEADRAIAAAAVAQSEAEIAEIETDIERCLVRAPVAGVVLRVNVRPGEYVGAAPGQGLVVLGDLDRLHVRAEIDENDIARFHSEAGATASIRGRPGTRFGLTFVRVEPLVVPKRSLTGDNTERIDTRVLQLIYAIEPGAAPLFVGQQMDVFINVSDSSQTTARKP